ncbi:peptidase C45 acyl-coenzyme A:6-aminopenicillanic acid acyl-transferase [Thermincola ferriacetica]|uniref:Peptidase C45 acyl-coenzyme A:6-aminopenicillanic acid acyl-transferase n=1 Tax=Thermincola ferriacetica TaxID=281456 RepID=A0A0L6W1B1_9FIRM|nr:C45 family peptidase [Thermincola ferriacetica]KNZ69173.1 peptidase C45 acyl-coenzyme A:6-aminopenicillanic acid acyl-transferase [Thermincola ferriacetica]
MAVRFLDCVGSHYMIGIQQGRIAKPAIQSAWEAFQNSQQLDMIRKSKLAPKALYIIHCQQKAENILKKIMKDMLPEQAERIKGLAEGADVPDKIIYLLQALEMELMPKVNMYVLGSGTLVGLKPEHTDIDEPVLLKNLDYSLPFEDMLLVRRCKPLAGCQTIEVTSAFLSGSHGGLNEHGLAILHTNAYPTDSISLKSIPITLLIQEALETCHSTEEAIRLISKYSLDSGANLLICDASGDMRVLETSRQHTASRFPEKGYIVATNHYLTPEMAQYMIPLDAVFTNKSLPRLQGVPVYESSKARYNRAVELLNKGPIDTSNLTEILANHSGAPSDNSICRHGPVLSTMASVAIFPKRGMVKVLVGKPCEKEFEQFTLRKI